MARVHPTSPRGKVGWNRTPHCRFLGSIEPKQWQKEEEGASYRGCSGLQRFICELRGGSELASGLGSAARWRVRPCRLQFAPKNSGPTNEKAEKKLKWVKSADHVDRREQ